MLQGHGEHMSDAVVHTYNRWSWCPHSRLHVYFTTCAQLILSTAKPHLNPLRGENTLCVSAEYNHHSNEVITDHQVPEESPQELNSRRRSMYEITLC